MRRLVPRWLALTAVVIAVLWPTVAAAHGAASIGTSTSDVRSAPASIHIDLWGDSIGYQDAPAFKAAFSDDSAISMRVRAFPGTGLCSWKSDVLTTATRSHPKAVVLQFLGPGYSGCAGPGPPLGDQRLPALKRVYVKVIGKLLADGVSSIEIVPAPTTIPLWEPYVAKLQAFFASIAASFETPKVTYLDAGVAVEAAGGGVRHHPALPPDRDRARRRVQRADGRWSAGERGASH